MTKDEKVRYWIKSAEHDWIVVGHLLEKHDYTHALFLAHLTLEKTLKALFVHRHNLVPPFTHRLLYLADKAEVNLTDEQTELLEIVTDFNLEARYPDEKFLFYKRCTQVFTEHYLEKIEVLKTWLLQQIQ
ncbi:MAG: HEPN domain-containing protein [Trichlorobacter sp.]|jgi:HEPN domain-containing protein|nr:HEPN domain-containing protein [Trichlorobacter sp.]